MDKGEIVRIIENFAPPELAEKWDCSGWLVETDRKEVERVLLCLTVTEDIIKQAVENSCDMIISHHPMFKINCHSELVSKSLKPTIDIYCAHTNMDMTHGGTTDKLIEILGYKPNFVDGFVRYVDLNISVEEFAKKLRKISENLRVVNNKSAKELKRIAFCAGSGSEFINEAREHDADCFVTGDLKFHTAVESDMVLFDIGHFESEIPVLGVFEGLLRDKVQIIFAKEKSPFC